MKQLYLNTKRMLTKAIKTNKLIRKIWSYFKSEKPDYELEYDNILADDLLPKINDLALKQLDKSYEIVNNLNKLTKSEGDILSDLDDFKELFHNLIEFKNIVEVLASTNIMDTNKPHTDEVNSLIELVDGYDIKVYKVRQIEHDIHELLVRLDNLYVSYIRWFIYSKQASFKGEDFKAEVFDTIKPNIELGIFSINSDLERHRTNIF